MDQPSSSLHFARKNVQPAQYDWIAQLNDLIPCVREQRGNRLVSRAVGHHQHQAQNRPALLLSVLCRASKGRRALQTKYGLLRPSLLLGNGAQNHLERGTNTFRRSAVYNACLAYPSAFIIFTNAFKQFGLGQRAWSIVDEDPQHLERFGREMHLAAATDKRARLAIEPAVAKPESHAYSRICEAAF